MTAIGGALLGGIIQAKGASDAAKAQTRAANKDIAFQKETRDIIRGDLSAYREGGNNAWKAYQSEFGLGPAPDGYQGFQKSQDYLFGLNEGNANIDAAAASRGMRLSGATLRDLGTYGQDYASTRREGYLNRLAGMSDTGLSAAQMSGNASTNAAAGVSNALAARGNAQAAGSIGRANAFGDTIGNVLGAWNYQKQYAMGAQ